MDFGWALLVQAVVTAAVVTSVLALFWFVVVRPHLDAKVAEIIEASRDIEPRIKSGVRQGMEETLRELPESTVKESTRQFLRFGSGLFENGLSSFLGDAPDLDKRRNNDL